MTKLAEYDAGSESGSISQRHGSADMNPYQNVTNPQHCFKFYVTDGNIMYLTDASRSLISCVIQHYAPVVGWGGGGTDA
jgi:hypothetical protein